MPDGRGDPRSSARADADCPLRVLYCGGKSGGEAARPHPATWAAAPGAGAVGGRQGQRGNGAGSEVIVPYVMTVGVRS